jgi:hypothetical protein
VLGSRLQALGSRLQVLESRVLLNGSCIRVAWTPLSTSQSRHSARLCQLNLRSCAPPDGRGRPSYITEWEWTHIATKDLARWWPGLKPMWEESIYIRR